MSMGIFSAEDVVSDLFAAEDTHYDDSGNGWHHEVTGNGNVIAIAITPSDDEGFKTDETFHFRAVVVKGEETPVLVSREFLTAARALYRWNAAASTMAAEQFAALVYEVDDALAALAPEQVAVLTGDGEVAEAETGGAAVVEQEPIVTAPTVFMVETEENVGATLVRLIDQDGLEVNVGLDDHSRDLLVSMLVRNGGAADV